MSNECKIIANSSGGYFLQGLDSRYSGFYLRIGSRMIKILEEVNSGKSNVFMIREKNGLLVQSKEFIELIFDVKESYDNSEFGRIYNVYEKDGVLVVKFTKDNRYSIFTVVSGYSEWKKTDKWIKKEYSYDKERNSFPFERYVYSAIEAKPKKGELIIIVSENETAAINDALNARKETRIADLIGFCNFNSPIEAVSSSLKYLLLKDAETLHYGIYAGLPWFFQFWSRDELISLKALQLLGCQKEAKDILLRNINEISADGRLPNQTLPLTQKTNADSIGWLFMRMNDFKFSEKEKEFLKIKIDYSVKNIVANYMREGLIYNRPLDTWMDTQWENDTREGFRIEIQALFLCMLKTAYAITKNNEYKDMEEAMRKLVREKFWNYSILADGLYDWTIRPNVFIAAYIYPELLTQEEWKICFNNVLPKLWLSWGGLSTIDKSNSLFCANHTGEVPQSYHRGDSWFWINNLAALVLHKSDKVMFGEYIDKIKKASEQEILKLGIIGQHCELSSASALKSQGCPAQAWSNAMFIEMMDELSKD